MKPLTLVLLLSIVLVLSIGSAISYYGFSKVVKVELFQMVGKVDRASGLGFNNTQIFFGKVMPGGSSWRNLSIKNSENFPVKIVLQKSGDIAQFVISEKGENVILRPNETNQFKLYFNPPLGTSFGTYSGTLRVIVKRI